MASLPAAQEHGSPPATPTAVPAARQASNVFIITVHGEIDRVTVRSIERRLELAQQAGADAVVFDIDTWGGQAVAAMEIADLIKQSPIRNTVAWVNPKAISAGTIIALGCREIVMSPGSRMGDVAPILPGLIPIPAAERAKIESPLLAEVVNSARRNGYDERLVMSFIAVDMELWLVEHRETGQRVFVDRGEYHLLFGEEPPRTPRMAASGGLPDPKPDQIPLIGRFYDPDAPTAAEGLSPEERQRMSEVEQLQELPSQRPLLTSEDRGQYVLVETVLDAQTLLVVDETEAKRYGLSRETVANEEELRAFFGATSVTRLDFSWSERFVQHLTSLPVRIVLLVVFLLGLIWELATPGVGIPIMVAIAAFLILFGAPALTGMAQWWDIALVILGLALIAVEIFILPGFGVAGVLGVICLGIGFIGTFIAPDPSGGILPATPNAYQGLRTGLAMFLLGFFGVGVGLWIGVKHFNRVPGLSRLVLAEQLGREEAPTMLAAMAPITGNRPAVGAVGVAVTPLRPVGRVRIGDTIYEVVSGRGVVPEGAMIRVTSTGAFEIIVEEDSNA